MWNSHLPKKTISQFDETIQPTQPAENFIQYIMRTKYSRLCCSHHHSCYEKKMFPYARPASIRPFISCSKWLYSPPSWIKYIYFRTHTARSIHTIYWACGMVHGAWKMKVVYMRTTKAEKTTNRHEHWIRMNGNHLQNNNIISWTVNELERYLNELTSGCMFIGKQ